MAQAKTRAPTSGGARKSQRRNASSAKSKSKSSSGKSKGSSGKSNGATRVDTARSAIESTAKGAGSTAKEAGQSMGRAAGKAKMPLLAGGAALVGAAGGLAVGARSRRTKGIARAIQRRPQLKVKGPQVKVKSRDLKHAAKEVGTLGAQMGRLASELQSAREEDGKHRSPVEVVLEGLTARRSRS